LIWSLDLEAFFGQHGWISHEALARLPGRDYTWSYFNCIDSPSVLWIAHIAALVVFLLLTLGLFSRTMAVLGFFITISYANRASFALFGLDDINAMLALYLAIGPCGAAYSLDRLLRRSRLAASLATRSNGDQPPAIHPRTDANISIRLIQIHMCVIYLFAALGKLMGPAWWNGSATWMSVANLEYQSMDMTWLAGWPILISLLTHVTVWWELSYCVLVWPRLTRPLMLALAIPIHLGIAMFLGMMTFGLAMLIANLAFVSPWLVRRLFGRRPAEQGRGGARAALQPIPAAQ
jgi:uncharacterized membrane protein YphA (DoxX/SURF4 family)